MVWGLIDRRRKALGLTWRQLGKKSGVQQSRLSDMRRRSVQGRPAADVLPGLADALGVDHGDLLVCTWGMARDAREAVRRLEGVLSAVPRLRRQRRQPRRAGVVTIDSEDPIDDPDSLWDKVLAAAGLCRSSVYETLVLFRKEGAAIERQPAGGLCLKPGRMPDYAARREVLLVPLREEISNIMKAAA